MGRYGAPERLVTYGGSIFKANQAQSVYRALGVEKEQIDRGKPWQSYIETTFNIQRRMADFYFAGASWKQLAAAHDRFVEDYNTQRHWAHQDREDGRRSPRDVLGFYTGSLRYREDDLERAFFSTRFLRVLDSRLRPLQGLEAVRRRRTRKTGRRHLAAAEEPHHRTRRGNAFALRRRTCNRHRQAPKRRSAEAVRDLLPAELAATEALCA